jgi:hypothetical protein
LEANQQGQAGLQEQASSRSPEICHGGVFCGGAGVCANNLVSPSPPKKEQTISNPRPFIVPSQREQSRSLCETQAGFFPWMSLKALPLSFPVRLVILASPIIQTKESLPE